MKKMMFNDRYCLTQAVIEGRKTMTRRGDGINPYLTDVYDNSVDRFNRGHIDCIELIGTKRVWAYKPRYKVGEIVAVAKKYSSFVKPSDWDATDDLAHTKGWSNKMFVKADLMPHQIRITGVRAERLQDITDEDCLREGISTTRYDMFVFTNISSVGYFNKVVCATARKAFAALIDKVSGKGTWDRNPWVWVYEFELLK